MKSSKLFQILSISIITIFFFLILDYLFGNYLNKEFKLFELDNITISTTLEKPTIKNKLYEYNFKKNISLETNYGSYKYNICTNDFSIRTGCLNRQNLKNYDFVFVGDSFTEGVGLEYEETFVGLFENNTNYKVANLGISGYSPYNYYYFRQFINKLNNK